MIQGAVFLHAWISAALFYWIDETAAGARVSLQIDEKDAGMFGVNNVHPYAAIGSLMVDINGTETDRRLPMISKWPRFPSNITVFNKILAICASTRKLCPLSQVRGGRREESDGLRQISTLKI